MKKESDYEKVISLQDILLSKATGGIGYPQDYIKLRKYFLTYKELPTFVKQKRYLDQFWNFVKYKFESYAERREYIYNEFGNLLNTLENNENNPLDENVANELNLDPDKYNEKIFKQILKGCSSVINGLALLRNNLGDSHGGKKVKPLERHSELAVNLSGAMSIFLFKTFNKK